MTFQFCASINKLAHANAIAAISILMLRLARKVQSQDIFTCTSYTQTVAMQSDKLKHGLVGLHIRHLSCHIICVREW